jgi:hypothetical protein
MMTFTAVLLPWEAAGAAGTGETLPATDGVAWAGVEEATVVPHFEQNFAPSDNGAPQLTQNAAMIHLRTVA